MNKRILPTFLILLIGFFVFMFAFNVSFATSGACSWHDGVNCSAGADIDGSVICNDGWRDSSVSYYSMDKCSGFGGGSIYDNKPDCPYNSSYNSLEGSCECNSGYVVQNGECVSGNSYCRDKLGLHGSYDYLSNTCECSYGYVLGEDVLGDISCISEDKACENEYGYHAESDNAGGCECSYGYTFQNGECVDEDLLDNNSFGGSSSYPTSEEIREALNNSCPKNSSYSDGNCVCDSGYLALNNTCVKSENYCDSKFGDNVHYDSSEDGCYCDSGYVFDEDENKCISGKNYCEKSFAANSKLNNESNKCECESGYSLNKNKDRCISKSKECKENYGLSSIYDDKSNSCSCKEDFIFNDSGERCVHKDSYCRIKVGVNSYYSDNGSCVCEEGFEKVNNKCEKVKTTEMTRDQKKDYKASISDSVLDKDSSTTSKNKNKLDSGWLIDFIKNLFF